MKLEIEEEFLKELLKDSLTMHLLNQAFANDELFQTIIEMDEVESIADNTVEIMKKDQNGWDQ